MTLLAQTARSALSESLIFPLLLAVPFGMDEGLLSLGGASGESLFRGYEANLCSVRRVAQGCRFLRSEQMFLSSITQDISDKLQLKPATFKLPSCKMGEKQKYHSSYCMRRDCLRQAHGKFLLAVRERFAWSHSYADFTLRSPAPCHGGREWGGSAPFVIFGEKAKKSALAKTPIILDHSNPPICCREGAQTSKREKEGSIESLEFQEEAEKSIQTGPLSPHHRRHLR
jgi:hypothetical protein